MINDCSDALVVCTSDAQTFNPDGPGLDDFTDPDNDPGCIPGLETNSAWYYFQIAPTCPPGLELGFIIHPDGGFGVDYDWALFGPNVDCGDLGSPLRCSGASFDCQFCPETGMGMGAMDFTEGPGFGDGFTATINVQPGEGYYLLVNNWLPTNTGFLLEWTGAAAPYLNCNVTPPCALYAVILSDIIVVCEGDAPTVLNGASTGGNGSETYSWSGTNGGTDFLSDPNAQYPLVNVPPGFTGQIIYTLTVTEGNCMGTDAVEFDVIPLTVIDITPIGPLCENSSLQTLTATPPGGIWSGDNNGNTFDPAAHGPGMYTVSYFADGPNECPNTESITIEVYESPAVSIDPDPAEFCADEGSILLTADATNGNGPYMYDWNTPSGSGTGNTYTATQTGAHHVLVTDANGCTNTAQTLVTVHPTPVVNITNPGLLCKTTTSIFLTATPAGGTFSGSIISPAGEIQPVNIASGTYTITYQFTDAFGCDGMASIDITIIDAPDAFASDNSPICEGGSVELYGSTSSTGPGITFLWTGPGGYSSYSQNPTDATEAGVYSLVVEIEGCTSVPAMTTVLLSSATDAMAQNGGPYCAGQSIQLSGSTATTGSSISYTWSGPNGYISTFQNPMDAIAPGTYNLIVDVDGCVSPIASTLVIVNPPAQPVITGQASFCTGFSSILDAGPGFLSYLWDDASVNQTREVFASGTYHVTVTDSNGCTGQADYTVTETPSLMPVIIGPLEFCEGSGTTLDAGAGYASYTWSTGDTTQTIQVTTGGNFGVMVMDATGCTGSTNATTIAHPNPAITIGGSATYCIGGSTILDAGTGYTAYMWSNGDTTPTITVSAPGLYSVDVIDAFGCMGSGSVNVTESTSLQPVITGNNTFCENGSTTLNAGSGFATYLWSDASMNQNLVVNTPGTYAVTVTDGGSCMGNTSITVSEVLPPSAVVQSAVQLCNTIAGGSVINLYDLVTAGDMSGSWTDVDQSGAVGLFTNLNFNNIPAGDYQFTYTTNSAVAPCPEATYQVIVTVLDCTCPDVLFFNAAPMCNASGVLDLSSIENTTEPGTWALIQTPPGSNPGTLNGTIFTATDSDQGQYTFQYSLQNQPPPGCPLDYQVNVQVDQAVDAGIPSQPLAYCADEDQIVSLISMITGADADGTWTETSAIPSTSGAFNAANGTFEFKEQVPGTYTFQYSLMANGTCPGDASTVTVLINPLPTVTITNPSTLDCVNPTQSLDASGSSSGPGYTIVWTGPGLVIDGNENTLQPTINKPGIYVLSITENISSCEGTASVVVIQNAAAPRSALVTDQNPSCFGDQNGLISVDQVIGGTPPYQYNLNNAPFASNSSFTDLMAGTYTLALQDATGCKWDTTLILVEPSEIGITLGPDIQLGLGQTATVEASINLPQNEIDTILWSPDDVIECINTICTEANIITTNTVTLTATVYDLYGCEASDQIRIVINKDRKLYVPNTFSPNGDGINDIFFISADPDQVLKIKKLSIYNRWGEELFNDTDFLPNDPAHGWDGSFRNVLINPEVFVYHVEVEYVDGEIENLTGDVTLMR